MSLKGLMVHIPSWDHNLWDLVCGLHFGVQFVLKVSIQPACLKEAAGPSFGVHEQAA